MEDLVSDAFTDNFAVLLEWRKKVMSALEPFRTQGHKTLDAHVILLMKDPNSLPLMLPDDLADLFIVSRVTVQKSDKDEIEIQECEGVSCPRCWKRHTVRVNFENLCDRCVHVVLTDHPNHYRVPEIEAALAMQEVALSWKW